MPSLPPHRSPHVQIQRNARSPTQDLPTYGHIEIPFTTQSGLLPQVGVELESGDALPERQAPHKRFSAPFPELRGAGLLTLMWAFFTGEINMNAFITWFRQPSTLTGVSALLGLLSSVAAGAVTWQHALGPIVAALVAIVVPDNTSTILHQSQANGVAVGAKVPAGPQA